MALFVLVDRLAPLIETEATNLLFMSGEEAKKLYFKLKEIQSALEDAESRAEKDKAVKNWLLALEDLVYEMEDVLDEWEVATSELEDDGSESDHPWEKLCSLVPSLCLCFKQELRRREIPLKMKALMGEVDKIREHVYRFALNQAESHFPMPKRMRSPTLANESVIYGRDYERARLVEMLVSGETSQVLSIVGMGGVGKTTLAQLVYNDPEIKAHFQVKAWVTVSYAFNALAVYRTILETIDPVDYPNFISSTLEIFVERIEKILSEKRFFIVLDDVWTQDPTDWDLLVRCLKRAAGSRILVTTRNETVARMMGSNYVHRLELLSEADCWKILARTASAGGSSSMWEDETLREIGMKIAEKSIGVPLAARTLGGMLAFKSTAREWEHVIKNARWDDLDEVGDVFRILKLCYFDMDLKLRHCFLSFVASPSGSLIQVDELIRIWMSYGFLSSSEDGDQAYLQGLDYYHNLATRSFFQTLEIDEYDQGMISFQVHDILRDLADYFSISKRYIILDGNSEYETEYWKSTRTTISFEKMHTFCARHISEESFFHSVIGQLSQLRMLIVSDCNLVEVPERIGRLIHLRYLDLSHNPLKRLPETISDLYFLQTLDLENCRDLLSLPAGIKKLRKLRYLLTSNTPSLKQIPPGLQCLTRLWTLSEFRAGKGSLGILGHLNELRGSLRLVIEGMSEVNDVDEARKANLREKTHIQHLELIFHRYVSSEVVEALQPPPALITLRIKGGHDAQQCPNWINPASLFNLKNLVIAGFDSLPPLIGTLPYLEKLAILHCGFKRVTLEFLGSNTAVGGGFLSLMKLEFGYCDQWEEWEDIKEQATESDYKPLLPRLRELSIFGCQQLKELPHNILLKASSLKVLSVVHSYSLNKRYNPESGADWEKISFISRVDILSQT